jgi:dTDP-4-amino-4,6-dideoxygalactose transaminase
MSNPHDVTRQFEADLCKYTGARFAVATNSCTNALLVCLDYFKPEYVGIPKKTYRGVAQSILNVGAKITWSGQDDWTGSYQLYGTPIFDYARRFTSGMYQPGTFQCLSFHYSKILNVTQGGAILHDDPIAQPILQAMTYDGALFGEYLHKQRYVRGWHCYMGPEVAALGRVKLACLPKNNPDLPNSDYPDLSLQGIFQ